MIEYIQQSRKIRAVPPNPDRIGGTSLPKWLRRLYRRYLKQCGIFRSIARWIWRNGYPVYANIAARLTNMEGRKWRQLVKLSEFAKATSLTTYKLADSAIVETPAPIVFPSSEQRFLVSPHDRYFFPEVYVAKIRGATTYGGTNLVFVDNSVVCHDLFDPERDFTSEELHGRASIDPTARRIRWFVQDNTPESIQAAAVFVDACALNYAHWMTEVLPRIALFCGDERFNGVPIVVNDGLHDNIMKSLFLVAGDDREIITLPIGRALVASELYVTSVAGYVPFERRSARLSGHSHGKFSPHALDRILSALAVHPMKSSKRIFLKRNSGVRKICNAHEIEELLVSRGFEIIEPETLSFIEQVQLFASATEVVASSGAALANIVFCPADARITVLIAKQPDTSYWYWQNLALASGKHVRYLLGKAQSQHTKNIHDDYYIPPEDVLRYVAVQSVS